MLGTKFNISAYPEDSEITTTLTQGRIKVTNLLSAEHVVSTLTPGQQSIVGQEGNQIRKDIDTEEAIAWTQGYFKFNESLAVLLKKIARWYDVDIVMAPDVNPEQPFVGKISRQTGLREVIAIISAAADLHYHIQERRVILTK